jgi:hypothetical protein
VSTANDRGRRRGAPSGSTLTKDKAMNDDTEFTTLGDPEFLAERRRVREELEDRPTVELTARYERLEEDFIWVELMSFVV